MTRGSMKTSSRSALRIYWRSVQGELDGTWVPVSGVPGPFAVVTYGGRRLHSWADLARALAAPFGRIGHSDRKLRRWIRRLTPIWGPVPKNGLAPPQWFM